MSKLTLDKINDFFINYSVDFQEKRHNEMLEGLTKLFIGRTSHLNDIEDLLHDIKNLGEIIPLQESSSKMLGKIIGEKGLDIQSHNFSKFSNSEFKKLLDFLDQEMNENINRYTFKFSIEEILIELLNLASVTSKLSLTIFSEHNDSIKPIDNLEKLGAQLRLIDKMHLDDIRSFIGDIKVSIECAVNTIFKDELKYSNSHSCKPINYVELLRLFHAKSLIHQIKEVIPILGETRKEFKLDNEKGIVLPQKVFEVFFAYSQDTKKEKAQVENGLTENLFNIFYESLEFQPKDIYSYATKNEGERAFRLYDNYTTLADKELLVNDIKNKQELTSNGIKNLLEIFTLNNNKFYEKNDKSKKEENYLGSANKRLFRAPIIDLGTKILMPTYTWVESLIYLPSRILNRDVYSDVVTKNWNELIKVSYDEYYLPELKDYLNNLGKNTLINVDLSKVECLKKEIENTKKMPHEIDLLFLENNNLIIMDLKNYGMQHNYRDIRLVIEKIDKQKVKMNRLKDFIIERKEKFEKILNIEFDNVKTGIITVSPTIYNYLRNKNDSTEVLSIKEFKEKYNTNLQPPFNKSQS